MKLDLITQKFPDNIKLPSIKIFDPDLYFIEKITKGINGIKLTLEGMELLVEYYFNKYQTDISLVNYEFENKPEKELRKALEIFDHSDCCRKAIIVTKCYPIISASAINEKKKNPKHSAPIFFVKENNKKAVFLLDCSGWTIFQELLENILPEDVELHLLKTNEARQIDLVSCHLDGIIFGKLATAKNEDGNYIIPNLLDKLTKRIIFSEGRVKQILLPNEFLIASQNLEFLNKHIENDDNIIVHKHYDENENLSQFLSRYNEVVFFSNGKREASTYLRTKGFRSRKIIELQHYIRELTRILESHIDSKLIDEFIAEAKNLFNHSGQHGGPIKKTLNDLTKEFLITYFPSLIIENSLDNLDFNERENLIFLTVSTVEDYIDIVTQHKIYAQELAQYVNIGQLFVREKSVEGLLKIASIQPKIAKLIVETLSFANAFSQYGDLNLLLKLADIHLDTAKELVKRACVQKKIKTAATPEEVGYLQQKGLYPFHSASSVISKKTADIVENNEKENNFYNCTIL